MECKVTADRKHCFHKPVLIETSWNVKACSPSNNLTAISINRNIVECKERSWICCMKRDRGINRNIVECKGTVG